MLTPGETESTSAQEQCSLLAVALHNLGTEREHQRNFGGAAVAYKQGSSVARKVLGSKNALTQALVERCGIALSKAERNPLAPLRVSPAKRPPSQRMKYLSSGKSPSSSRPGTRGRGASLHQSARGLQGSVPPLVVSEGPYQLLSGQ